MFKIHDDKVYFVAETPNINKVIEIFLPKDDRGTIMDSHEIRVDLCRAVIHMEKKGVRVLKVRNIEDTNKALDEFCRIQQTGEYWEAHDGKSLTDAIHEFRWAILKDAIQKRGHEAVADFVGTDISSDTYDRVMDETEAQMPDEEFERFWEKYI